MKKFIFVLIVFTTIIGCKKENSLVTLNCKLSKVIHIVSGGSTDTTTYSYTGDDMSYTTKYSSDPTTINTYSYTKAGGQYTYEILKNGVLAYDGIARLNAQGKIDSTRVTYLATMLFNNRNRSYYDTDGKVLRAISNYNTYENDVKYYYTSDGNYAYWIYDFYDFRPVPAPSKDSVTFEYYLDKPKKAEKFGFERKFGNLEKNLVKKRYYYDLLNSGTLKKTYEYEYLTDANGLVTREIWTVKNQPGNIETRRDTTYYQYTCN
ncbi:MAG: hypothetical protein IT271_14410 [Chitinophagales bacterium]|nr:hypothetical protein [Chitinophagales bacterium]